MHTQRIPLGRTLQVGLARWNVLQCRNLWASSEWPDTATWQRTSLHRSVSLASKSSKVTSVLPSVRTNWVSKAPHKDVQVAYSSKGHCFRARSYLCTVLALPLQGLDLQLMTLFLVKISTFVKSHKWTPFAAVCIWLQSISKHQFSLNNMKFQQVQCCEIPWQKCHNFWNNLH